MSKDRRNLSQFEAFCPQKRNDGPEAMKMTVAPQIAQAKQLGETQRDHILRQKQ